jgi:aspartate racemase
MATVYFYEMLTSHTKASCDQEHIDILISSRATTPDRTAFILGKSDESPIGAMIEEGKRLQECGADIISMPCNTAHYFYDGLQRACSIPILNIIEQTAQHLSRIGVRTFGLCATQGTVRSASYERFCSPLGLCCLTPTEEEQAILSDIIYGQIKKGLPVDYDRFFAVADSLRAQGCQTLILGCTELSVLKRQFPEDTRFVDSLETLAFRAITLFDHEPVGFTEDFYV